MRSHLGTSFSIWNRQRTWFWLVRHQQDNGAVIGTASSESEAVREARSSIEEMAMQSSRLPAVLGAGRGNALVAASSLPYSCNPGLGWMDLWMNIAQQVIDRMLTRWADSVTRSS